MCSLKLPTQTATHNIRHKLIVQLNARLPCFFFVCIVMVLPYTVFYCIYCINIYLFLWHFALLTAQWRETGKSGKREGHDTQHRARANPGCCGTDSALMRVHALPGEFPGGVYTVFIFI